MEKEIFRGTFAEMRLSCLKAYHPEKLHRMEEDGTLDEHLKEIQDTYTERYNALCDRLMDKFAKENEAAGGSYTDYMLYTTTASSQAREIITQEIREL